MLALGWLVYAAAGCLQGTLLVMCLFWKARQRRLGIDDFGNPLPDAPDTAHWQHHVPSGPPSVYIADTAGTGTEAAELDQQVAISAAVRDAIETTPLLPASTPDNARGGSKGWFDGLLGGR